MADPKSPEVFARIRDCSQLVDLAPSKAAEIFRRRLRLVDETESQDTYELVGGEAGTWSRVEFRWLKKHGRGILFADLASGIHIPMQEAEAEFGEFPAFVSIPGDPRDPTSKGMIVYPVAAGELRLVCPDFEARYTLCGFVVDPFPMVDWSAPRE